MSVQITQRRNRFPERACSSPRQCEQVLDVRPRQVKRGRLSETGDRLSGGRTAQAAKSATKTVLRLTGQSGCDNSPHKIAI
jgi:hypothetical protein